MGYDKIEYDEARREIKNIGFLVEDLKKGVMVILSGPSGAGKDTIAREVVRNFGEQVKKVVTYTTRPPRLGEKNHKDYHFVPVEKFMAMVNSSFFLEWAKVHGHFYGSPWKNLKKPLSQGKIVLLVLDIQGGLAVKKRYPEAVLVFVVPSRWTILQKRLLKRGLDEKDNSLRLKNAWNEVQALPGYDYLVVNDDLTEAVESLTGILRAEQCRVFRHLNRLSLPILRGKKEVSNEEAED